MHTLTQPEDNPPPDITPYFRAYPLPVDRAAIEAAVAAGLARLGPPPAA